MFKPVSPKVDFPELERNLMEKWKKDGLVEKYLHRNDKSEKKFSFLDGPITANNPMGVHHAWGRTYKDVFQRFWNMRGYKQRFQNGFDEQGLWVEVEVEKELGLRSKKDIENLVPGDKFKSLEKFVNLCKERVKKYSAIQTEQSKRLGYFMDWDNSYHTSSDQNNYDIWHFLKTVHEKGWLYKGHDSVPWCPRCGTAISQHEILTEDYKALTHKSVTVKFPIGRGVYLLAWTTTPWSIPGTIALMVNPKFDYVKVKQENGEYVLVKERVSVLKGQYGIMETFKGERLVGTKFVHPFSDFPALKGQKFPVIPSEEFVTADMGTGIVTNNPGVGHEDYLAAKEVNLLPVESIDESAHFLEGYAWLSGKYAKNEEAINQILQELNEKNFVYELYNFTHQYPVCWRCKSELVFRVVDEWYIHMDKKDRTGKTYREQMKKIIKNINWIPKWGYDRELDWLNNLHDWLISKKRYWGLALPIWECQNCGKFTVIGSLAELKEKATEGFEKLERKTPHRPWIDKVKIKCQDCSGSAVRIPDVGNPWLDAGIVPFSTMPKDWFPADFITESFPGQFKNWFYSLIAMSTVLRNKNPFKTVLGFASATDEKGEEMHKSKGNAIEFNEAADKIGVDVMRWMYVCQDPERNLLFGYHVADKTRRKFHLMLWNIYNFFVNNANIDKWEIKIGKIKSKNILDKWIMSRLNYLVKIMTESLENYDAFTASNAIGDFVNDLSTWYIRRSRDRVGPTSENKEDKKACHETLWEVLASLCQLLAPLVPFISEEIYRNLTKEESVHLSNWPEVGHIDEKINQEMVLARKIVEMGHAKRKENGIKVRQPLSQFKIQNSKFKIDEELISLIKDELNVKSVAQIEGKGELTVDFETHLTKELINEGKARDIIRQIQGERKRIGTKPDETISVVLEEWPAEFKEDIKKKALIKKLSKGKFLVEKND